MTDPRPVSCARHQALVDRAWADDASAADLDAFAAEAADCADCAALLSLRLSAHPEVLRRGGTLSVEDGWDQIGRSVADDDRGMRALAAALAGRDAVAPRRGWIPLVIASAVAAVAAVTLALFLADRSHTPAADPSTAAPPQASASPAERWLEPATRAVPPSAPVASPSTPSSAERAPVALPEPAPVAVASADWPNPPFEDLVGATPKSAEPAGRVLRLEVDVPVARVGDRLPLAIASSRTESVAVCVDGPESGMIWRGAVPAGATPLTSGGRPVSFRFERAGRYHLWTSRDVATCRDPVDVVEVEVGP